MPCCKVSRFGCRYCRIRLNSAKPFYNQRQLKNLLLIVRKEKQELAHQELNQSAHQLIYIGPEGDFTKEEIAIALQNNFIPVALGETRLRTETAGVVAAVILLR